jgi:hypothetical protein
VIVEPDGGEFRGECSERSAIGRERVTIQICREHLWIKAEFYRLALSDGGVYTECTDKIVNVICSRSM